MPEEYQPIGISGTAGRKPRNQVDCESMKSKKANTVRMRRERTLFVGKLRLRIGLVLLAGLTFGGIIPSPAPASPETEKSNSKSERPEGSEIDKPWHLDLSFRSFHPRLSETKAMLDQRLKVPMRMDWAHLFDEPYTPVDRNTDWGFGGLSIGVGRQENDWLLWTVYGGGGSGEDRNFQRILFETLEVNFKYRYVYFGGEAEIYPWKIPTVRPQMSFDEKLRASRPFLLTGLEAGYVSSDGEGAFRAFQIPTYRDSAHIRDWVSNLRLGLGWSFPLSTSFSLQLSGDYAFNFYRPDEYNGWQLIAGLRYRF